MQYKVLEILEPVVRPPNRYSLDSYSTEVCSANGGGGALVSRAMLARPGGAATVARLMLEAIELDACVIDAGIVAAVVMIDPPAPPIGGVLKALLLLLLLLWAATAAAAIEDSRSLAMSENGTDDRSSPLLNVRTGVML